MGPLMPAPVPAVVSDMRRELTRTRAEVSHLHAVIRAALDALDRGEGSWSDAVDEATSILTAALPREA